MPVLFKRATLTDLEIILSLMTRMQRVDPWDEPFDENAVRINLIEVLQSPTFGSLHIAVDGERPIGYVVVCFDFSLEYHGRCAWIDELYVEDEHGGKGTGTQLLNIAEEISRQHGARTLHLEVNRGNRAIELYRRLGFVDHQRYLMTKSLFA